MRQQVILGDEEFRSGDSEELELTESQKKWLEARAREAYMRGEIPIDWLEQFISEEEARFLESLQN